MSRINFAETGDLMKFPAEIMKHDPMDIRASSPNPHTINHPPKHTSTSFHQQVMLMSGQNDSHLPTSLHHIQNIYTIQETLTVSMPIAKSHLQQMTVALTVFSVL